MLLSFGAVALVAAGMVISNTFTVIVAQRTRELALLRCVGATRRQVRRGVLTEAGALGIAASAVGVAAGIGVAHLAIAAAGRAFDAAWLPTQVDIPPTAVLVPLAVGLLVTVAASLTPARAATRVAPLEALRPQAAPSLRSRTSRARLTLAVALLLVGGAMLAAGVMFSRDSTTAGLMLGVVGGAVSLVGVLAAAVMVVPPVVAALGRVLGRFSGVPGKMAAVNAIRHPRRTASTTAALFIGVTLVAMMSTGASSTQATLEHELDQRYPVDIVVDGLPLVRGDETGDARLPSGIVQAVTSLDDVAGAAELNGVEAVAGDGPQIAVLGVDRGEAEAVVRSESSLDGLVPGAALIDPMLASEIGVDDGEELTLAAGGRTLTVTVATDAAADFAVLMSAGDLAELAPDASVWRLWLALHPGADAGEAVRDVQDAVSAGAGRDGAVPVFGPAAERAEIADVLDTMLAVVTGLLAVAVVIALIGVGNTLSLSVIERSRESATMRALGLTRRQLRAMLAFEGMLIAVAGALLGVVLGAVYGWLGTLTALSVWDVSLAVPWVRFGAIVIVAILAGLLASVLPGRRAARAAPVAALAAE